MKKHYIFYNTCYDRETFRKQTIVLDDHQIDYKIINKYNKSQFRAPLSVGFEAEIHILDDDFTKADLYLKGIDTLDL